MAESPLVITSGLLDHGHKEMSAGEVRLQDQRLLDEGPSRFGLALLDQSAANVEPTVGVLGLGFGHAAERVLSSFEIALQQEADAPVIPALAILLADHRFPMRFAQLDFGGGCRKCDDG